MHIDLIPNRGPATMQAELQRSLRNCNAAFLGSAFLTPSGLEPIKACLPDRLAGNRTTTPKVRLLIGFYNRFTSPNALRGLLSLQRKCAGRLEIKVARNERFHWKCYVLKRGQNVHCYIGSANLTGNGLNADGELTLKLTDKFGTSIVEDILTEFQTIWDRDSIVLTDQIVKDYAKLERPHVQIDGTNQDSALQRLMRRPKRSQKQDIRGPIKSPRRKLRLVHIDDTFSEGTEEIVSQKTDWDKKDYWYFTATTKQRWDYLRQNKYFVLVTWYNANSRVFYVELDRVEDALRIRTADGQYFLAHSKVPGTRSCKYTTIKETLATVGLGIRKIRKDPVLNQFQRELLYKLLMIDGHR